MLVAISLWSLAGCQPTSVASPDGAADHDHGDHDNGHDHGHEGHDHDHAGHAHDHHDHGDHDHDHGDETVDAGAMGISADDLPMLEKSNSPSSFADAVAQLGQTRDQIKEGFENDDPESVHGQLHDVGSLLESLEAFVLKAKWDKDVQESAAEAVDSLFDSYGAIDAKLHGQDGKEYSDVSEAIDTAVATLMGITKESE
ncbi:MAG: hypothetical protein AAGD07_06030 [Planctomycetota bacterium]